MDQLSQTSPILQIEQTRNWLNQFELGDRILAEALLSAFHLVSRDEFHDHLRTLILERASLIEGVVALYAERELRHRWGVPHRLFKESAKKPLRAEGKVGPAAVKATKAYDSLVGSEGIVAQLIAELCRESPHKFISHPGPEKIRQKKVRAFWVVTDLVGTGHRAYRYLEAAWRVRSVRSWWSGHFLQFAVVAYASTNRGNDHVKSHRCNPEIIHVMPCPTIDSAFSKTQAVTMKRLCEMYDPTISKTGVAPWTVGSSSLGYDNTGALLVFAHGAPNNIPLMFHKASKRKHSPWIPLFPARVSATIDSLSFGGSLSPERIQKRLSNIGQLRLAKSKAIMDTTTTTGEVFLILGALSHPQRLSDSALSHHTGMPTYQVARLCKLMASYGWIDSRRRLTDAGQGQLRHARKNVTQQMRDVSHPIGQIAQKPYYPKSLRPPV